MGQTKYIMSGGLAFSEYKDMEKLRQFSLKGWHVSDFRFMGYSLTRGESADYIYSVDYQSLKEEEAEEYFDFFSSAGWSHVASNGYMHLFRAQSNTKPIYSDRGTTAEKYGNLASSLNYFAIPFLLVTVLLWVGAMISSGMLQSIFNAIAIIFTVIAFPTALTVIANYQNKWKAKERKGLFLLFTLIPMLLLLIALLAVNTSSIRIVVSMLLGAIALPTAIWIYQKIASKKA